MTEQKELFRDPAVPGPTELSELANSMNYTFSADELKQCHSLITDAVKGFNRFDHLVEPTLPVKYPRTPGYRPTAEENPYNAWYWKSTIKGVDSGKLLGKKIAIKDNVMVAGVPMMNGCRSLEGTIPHTDATVVTRLLDAGGTILGKAKCDNLCLSGSSFTPGYGPVCNFHHKTRSAGASSCGSAVLKVFGNEYSPSNMHTGPSLTNCGSFMSHHQLMTGEVDMTIGGDHGGSIRIPSTWNGCVGLKPTSYTWGLVPYTGAMAIEPTIDHLGPMARTVHDCALMLEVHVVTKEDIKSNTFTIQDVVLPLPGNSVQHPSNKLGHLYQQHLNQDGLSQSSFRLNSLKINIPGDYRKLLEHPTDLTYRVYEDTCLVNQATCEFTTSIPDGHSKTAMMSVSGGSNDTHNCESNITNGTSHNPISVRLSFRLPPSSCATICIREMMKE